MLVEGTVVEDDATFALAASAFFCAGLACALPPPSVLSSRLLRELLRLSDEVLMTVLYGGVKLAAGAAIRRSARLA